MSFETPSSDPAVAVPIPAPEAPEGADLLVKAGPHDESFWDRHPDVERYKVTMLAGQAQIEDWTVLVWLKPDAGQGSVGVAANDAPPSRPADAEFVVHAAHDMEFLAGTPISPPGRLRWASTRTAPKLRPLCPGVDEAVDRRMKIATYNVNGVNGRPAGAAALAGGGPARRRLPAGAEGAAGEVSAGGHRGGRLWRDLARARRAGTAWRSWPRGGELRSRPAAVFRAIPRTCTAAISRRRSAACSSAASTCPTAIPRPGPSSTTSCAGSSASRPMPAAARQQTCRWCWPATTTSCPPTSTSTSRSAGWTTPCSDPRCREAYRRLRRARLDRRPAQPPPRRAHLHLLGLFPERLCAGRRTADRPSAAQSDGRAEIAARRGRSARAGLGEDQRSCADVDRARSVARPRPDRSWRARRRSGCPARRPAWIPGSFWRRKIDSTTRAAVERNSLCQFWKDSNHSCGSAR